jgi:hypothetical protein
VLRIEPALLQHIPAHCVSHIVTIALGRNFITMKEGLQLAINDEPQAWDERIQSGVGRHASRISHKFLAPHESGFDTQIDDMREETTEERQANPLA